MTLLLNSMRRADGTVMPVYPSQLFLMAVTQTLSLKCLTMITTPCCSAAVWMVRQKAVIPSLGLGLSWSRMNAVIRPLRNAINLFNFWTRQPRLITSSRFYRQIRCSSVQTVQWISNLSQSRKQAPRMDVIQNWRWNWSTVMIRRYTKLSRKR